MGALERYTANLDHLKDLPKDMLEVIVLVARKNWRDNPAKNVIRNLEKDPEFAEILAQYGDVDSDED
jgi:hypothetical protein